MSKPGEYSDDFPEPVPRIAYPQCVSKDLHPRVLKGQSIFADALKSDSPKDLSVGFNIHRYEILQTQNPVKNTVNIDDALSADGAIANPHQPSSAIISGDSLVWTNKDQLGGFRFQTPKTLPSWYSVT